MIRAVSLLLICTIVPVAQSPTDSWPPANLTLDAVQKNQHEVTYEEIASLYGGPMSKHPVVSVKAHPEAIWVRPDMGLGMIANPIAFGIGTTPKSVPWREVERSLEKGYLPIITSRLRENRLLFEQLAYATLLNDREVKTGHEKQVAMVRMSVTNTDPSENRHATLWAFIPAKIDIRGAPTGPPFHEITDTYAPFEVVGSLPQVPSEPISSDDDVLRNGSVLLGVHEEGPGIQTTRYDKVLKYEMDLLPGQRKSIWIKLSSNKKGFSTAELDTLRRLDFLSALDQVELEQEAILAKGTKIQVPEEIVNRIYKAQILYDQQLMVQAADKDYYFPVQSYIGMVPWEAMKMLVPLDAAGYHDDTRRCLKYFIEIQGLHGPHGQNKSEDGTIPICAAFEKSGWENDESTIYGLFYKERAAKEKEWPNWLGTTGGALYAFAEHYFYSRDRNWLQSVSPALIKACNWIISERQHTKQMDVQGQKVLHYGLMPAGEAYDGSSRSDNSYYFCFVDGYSYQGLKRVAEALVDIKHPEGPRLLREAESYRQDILEVMRRTRQLDPNKPPYPERLYHPEGWGSYVTGPLSLVDTGLLDPSDPAFEQQELYSRKKFNILGFNGWLPPAKDGTRGSVYPVTPDDIFYFSWLERGEVEKALLTFYSVLGLAVDKQTLGSVERFSLYDQRFAPYYMNGSANSRIAAMIRGSLLLEKGSVLRLLFGAPRRWLENGKKISVKDAVTYFGELDMTVESRLSRQEILVDINLRKDRAERLRSILLRVPNPSKQKFTSVVVNGKNWKDYDPQKEIIELQPTDTRFRIIAKY